MNFECNKCGNCCKNPPHLTLDEMLTENMFDFNYSIVFVIDKKVKNLNFSRNHLKHHVLFNYHDKDGSVYSVTPKIIASKVGNYCEKYNPVIGCTINERKPSHCKVFPLNSDYSQTDQDVFLSELKSDYFTSPDLKCEGLFSGEPLYKNGVISNSEYLNTYRNSLVKKSKTIAILKDYFSKKAEYDEFFYENLMKYKDISKYNQNDGRVLVIDKTDFFNWLKDNKVISEIHLNLLLEKK